MFGIAAHQNLQQAGCKPTRCFNTVPHQSCGLGTIMHSDEWIAYNILAVIQRL